MFKGGHIFQTIILGIQPLLFGRILYPKLDGFCVKKPNRQRPLAALNPAIPLLERGRVLPSNWEIKVSMDFRGFDSPFPLASVYCKGPLRTPSSM